ncbi:MAG: hypothetical protein AAGK37_11345 [Pseudomonadota bacterium]
MVGNSSKGVHVHLPQLDGVEAVNDKDLASELLARKIGADLLVATTDADAVLGHAGSAGD